MQTCSIYTTCLCGAIDFAIITFKTAKESVFGFRFSEEFDDLYW